MHPSELSREVTNRLMSRRGRVHIYDRIDPKRTALVVIDMQNAFCKPGKS